MINRSASDFAHFFVTDLIKELKRLEVRRRAVLGRVKILIAVTAGVVGASVAIVIGFGLDMPPIFVTGVISIGGASALYKYLVSGYVHDFKISVIQKIVRFIDQGLVYCPRGHVSPVEFNSSRIFTQRPDRMRGDDLVEGKIGYTNIRFSEVQAERKTQSTGRQGHRRKRYSTIFKGLFFIGDFNKKFHGKTVVLPDSAERLLGSVGSFLQSVNRSRGEVIRMDNPEFEKYFVVYGDDQIESRYILSTSLMQRILDFRKKTDKRVYISFVGSDVFVAIPYKRSLFEPSVFYKLTSFKGAHEHFENLNLVLGIVDDLNLNTRIWAGAGAVEALTMPVPQKKQPGSDLEN
jgi:hypothetical protein